MNRRPKKNRWNFRWSCRWKNITLLAKTIFNKKFFRYFSLVKYFVMSASFAVLSVVCGDDGGEWCPTADDGGNGMTSTTSVNCDAIIK